jgi:thiol-disulfide isomerase/thioredoxin
LGYALVGRCTESKKGFKIVWYLSNYFFNYLLSPLLLMNFPKYLVILIVGVISVSLVSCKTETKKQDGQSNQTSEINELPYLNFNKITGELTSTRSLPGSSIIVLFKSDCSHCQEEATHIQEKIDAFSNYQLFFISSDSIHQVIDFAKKYGLLNKPNVHFGTADYRDIYTVFGSIPTPSIYIYSRQRKFVKSFLGTTPVEDIIKFL